MCLILFVFWVFNNTLIEYYIFDLEEIKTTLDLFCFDSLQKQEKRLWSQAYENVKK